MLRQFGFYGLIAGFCAALNIAVLICGEYAKLHYILSSLISFLICVCVGYALHCRFTFRSKPGLDSLLRYTMAMSFNLPGSLACLWLTCDLLGFPMTLAAPATTVLLTGANYLLSRWAVLPRRGMSAPPVG